MSVIHLWEQQGSRACGRSQCSSRRSSLGDWSLRRSCWRRRGRSTESARSRPGFEESHDDPLRRRTFQRNSVMRHRRAYPPLRSNALRLSAQIAQHAAETEARHAPLKKTQFNQPALPVKHLDGKLPAVFTFSLHVIRRNRVCECGLDARQRRFVNVEITNTQRASSGPIKARKSPASARFPRRAGADRQAFKCADAYIAITPAAVMPAQATGPGGSPCHRAGFLRRSA